MTIGTWYESAVSARIRCKVLEIELQMIMGENRGRIADWCCRFLAFNPNSPGYETLLRKCREMALAGYL